MLKFLINNKLYKNRKEAKADIGLWAYKCAEKKGLIIYINEDDEKK